MQSSYERLGPSYSIVFLKEKLWHEQIDTSRHHPVTPALPPDRRAITKEDLLPDSLITRYMFGEEKSRIFVPLSIFCIFAQLGRFNKTLEECSDELEYMLYWFKHSSENETVPEMFADIPFLDELSDIQPDKFLPVKEGRFIEMMTSMTSDQTFLNIFINHSAIWERSVREN